MTSEQKRIALQCLLFVLTFITTTIAGAEWRYGYSVYTPDPYTWEKFFTGLPYSMAFLFILTVHEFGHYFMARYHQIKTSLPYYIPLPPFPTLIGTLGALIRIRQRIPTTSQNFDVGIAGPLAGFLAAIGVLIFGMLTLPPPEYIFTVHPGYEQYGLAYADYVYTPTFLAGTLDIVVGDNFMMRLLAAVFADPARMPNPHELMHYPLLFAGYLSLVFTAINLLPIGQLDGGHVVYGLFGSKGHRWIASTVFVGFVFYAGIGVIGRELTDEDIYLNMPLYAAFLFFTFRGLKLDTQNTIIVALAVFLGQFLIGRYMPEITGFNGFLLLAFILGRFIGVMHPGAEIQVPLTLGRKILGWIALTILVLCFSATPLDVKSFPEKNAGDEKVSTLAPAYQQ